MKRFAVFSLMVPVAGGLVGVLSDTALHRAHDVLPEASTISFVLGCIWGVVPAALCGFADWQLEEHRLRTLIVGVVAFVAGVFVTLPEIDVAWSFLAGCLTVASATLCCWLSGRAA